MTSGPSTNSRGRGRPKSSRDIARPNRVVTFVTDQELELLQQMAAEEDRSMAAVVHRVIKAYFDKPTKDDHS